MHTIVLDLLDFVKRYDGIDNKEALAKLVQVNFSLIKDRSVYYCDHFAIRFSQSMSGSFSNTVISLSALQKYDVIPFIVCVTTSNQNLLYLANSTFLSKVSHSSQELRINNIRGSINGSDIIREFNGIANSPRNFETLFSIHAELDFAENLPRLVEATNNIMPSGQKYILQDEELISLYDAPFRALQFITSPDYITLKSDLDEKVKKLKNEVLIASFIPNVNIRGRIIEYLIAGENESLRQELINALKTESGLIPQFKTKNDLGDYKRIFDKFSTTTDVKTKIMLLNSNPKGYNIDKLLEFLAGEKSVFMFYFIGINFDEIMNPILVSMFQQNLLQSTILLKHWAGRNSRGVTQFEGKTLNRLINEPNNDIDIAASRKFLDQLIEL
jgi:hypothetical protein